MRDARVLILALLAGCASTPKEVVELSYALGQDLQAVHESHRALVRERFDAFRRERTEYFENEWRPKFIENWTRDGRLADVAAGRVVWSGAQKAFVAPAPARREEQMFDSIQSWSKTALKKLEGKKRSLLDPLDADEKAMLEAVDEAFHRLDRANAAITAHLNSLRKVQEVQDEALEALKAKGLRERLQKALVDASEKAERGMEEIRKADGALRKIKDVLPGD